MQIMLAKLSQWNQRMNGIPRKCLLIAVTLLSAWLAVAVFPYCWPFVLAAVFSFILEPFVRLVSGWLQKWKMGRSIATLLGMLLLFGLAAVLLTLAIGRLWREVVSLKDAVPGMLRWTNSVAIPWLQDQYAQYQNVLPSYAKGVLDNVIVNVSQMVAQGATSLTSWITAGAWRSAMSIVDVVLSVVLTIMGTYYLTADKARIGSFFHRTFPQDVRSHGLVIKTNLIRSLFGQVKSQLNVSLIIILFLISVFLIFRIPYGLLLGLLIGIADALPVIGAGLFLIPLSLFGFLTGDLFTGIFMACVYVGTIVIRQIFEPRIVGKNLGLYPLATMVAMYAGYRMFGFLGLLGGPVLLNIIKVILTYDQGPAPQPPQQAPAAPVPKPTDGPIPSPDAEITLPRGKKIPVKVRSK